MKTKVYLIRHAESEDNSQLKFSGSRDVAITPAGIRRCEVLRDYFKKFPITCVFTSPLMRAKVSAKILFPEHKIEVIRFLRELDYGLYEGYNYSQGYNDHDEILFKWLHSPSKLTFPSGDNVEQFSQYLIGELSELVMKHPGEVLACISHRTTIRLLLSKMLKLDLDEFRRIPCSNCSVSEITWKDKVGFDIESINANYCH